MKNLIFLFIVSLFLMSCEKESPSLTVLIDMDGNLYHTVMVGNQEWMVENLKVTHFNDGTDIPLVEDQNIWNNLPSINSSGYCYYNNDESNKSVYGCLYNWNAINSKKLAPEGWHVATSDDWSSLVNSLGGLEKAGGKLKVIGTQYWKSPNVNATNESGLSVLPAGYRGANGFTGLSETTSMAGSNLILDYDGTQKVLAVSAYSNEERSGYGAATFEIGLSVRCVRDVTFVNDGAK